MSGGNLYVKVQKNQENVPKSIQYLYKVLLCVLHHCIIVGRVGANYNYLLLFTFFCI